MITENELDIKTGETVAVDTDGEDSTRVKKMVSCGNDYRACPHGPYEYHVHREAGSLNWEYIGRAETDSHQMSVGVDFRVQ